MIKDEHKTLETGDYEFKREFTGTAKEWLEIVKDIVAMANSGGGQILFGLDDNGDPSECEVCKIDPASITDKIARYTGEQFSKFSLERQAVQGKVILVLNIGETDCPLIFSKPGTYEIAETKRQMSVFSVGSVYFRHGAKSEPGNTADLRKWGQQNANRAVDSLKVNLRLVTELPAGHVVKTLPITEAQLENQKIRLTNDPTAIGAKLVDPYSTHPYRQTDLIFQFNTRMQGKIKITSHTLVCVKKIFEIEKRPEFYYKPPFKSTAPVYSDLYLLWLIDQYQKDPHFFEKARNKQLNSARFVKNLDFVPLPT